MTKPKVIIFESPHPKKAYQATVNISAFCGDNKIRPETTNFTDVLSENISRFFGLPLSREAYDPNECIPEFFGYSPNSIYQLFEAFMIAKFGKQYFGRVMARRLHRDQIAKVYLIYGTTYPESLLAVANEVGIANMLFVNLLDPNFTYPSDHISVLVDGYQNNTILQSIPKIDIPYLPDYALHSMVLRGNLKEFLGIDGDIQ